MADQSEQIQTNALAPAQVTVDGQTVVQQAVPDQIAGNQYAAQAAALAPLHSLPRQSPAAGPACFSPPWPAAVSFSAQFSRQQTGADLESESRAG